MKNHIGLFLLGLMTIGCNNTSSIDTKLQILIKENNLTGNPLMGKTIPSIRDEKVKLGMNLFFSKSLGADRDSACVTCHHPLLGGGDNLSLPIGVGAVTPNLLGKGRKHNASSRNYDGGPTVGRNAPTTFNILAWNTHLFHDGRIAKLSNGISTPDTGYNHVDALASSNLASAQSRFPLTSHEEMKGFNNEEKNNQEIREYVASRLGGYGLGAGELDNTIYWLTQFQKALGKANATAENLITEQNIAELIGEYENSQAFIDTPWKSYVEGTTIAISEHAKEGALLFFKPIYEGGANCVQCHSGDFFTDEKFYNIAVPQIGRGKGDGIDATDDFGRMRVTGVESDKYKFRTPTLLNVAVTGPWGHSGAYTTLEGMVRHHLNVKTAIDNYDTTQLTQSGVQNVDKMQVNTTKALTLLEADRTSGEQVLQNVSLSDKQVSQLVSFLNTLTDSCVADRDCLKQWIPRIEEDPNGDQLDATFN